MMIEEDSWDSFEDIPGKKSKRAYKLDVKSKFLIIKALDAGQSQSKVAKDHNVTQQTISNIYKQKEHIMRMYAIDPSIFIEAPKVNIDKVLVEWCLKETKCHNYINKNSLKKKALEISFDSINIDDWINKFLIKHNIAEFFTNIKCDLRSKNEWTKFMSNFDSSEVYIGGVFALSHKLDVENYLSGMSSEEYVSMMFAVNTLGTDKQQLAVVGKDEIVDFNIKSLPVKYYGGHTDTTHFNYSILNAYLENWDSILNKVGKNILLIVNLPENLLQEFKLMNIKLLSIRNLDYATHVLEKLIECFKYNYRRLQISHKFVRKECLSQLDYIYMLAMAWHTVSSTYIELLCSQKDGFLYFDGNGENYGNHSLSHWYKTMNISPDVNQYPDLLDKYIYCDSKLKSVDWRVQVEDPHCSSNVVNTPLNTIEACASLEAYQAMRRLVSYLHSQNAGQTIKHAKYLEYHIEYRALIQMHVINKFI